MTPDQQPITRADLAAFAAELRANQDRAVESIANDFSQLRLELGQRMQTLERTMERNTEALRLVQLGMANLNR